MRVAYLGPKYSFSYEALLRVFPSVDLVPVETIQKIFSVVEKNKADFGLIPLENSIEGSVNNTLDALIQTDLVIVADLLFDINHCLVSKEKDKSRILRVFSHPQALAQCRQWITKHFPSVELIEMASTSKAAEWVSKECGSAAIASKSSANQFSLNVLYENISDVVDNKTRFAIISKASNTSKFPVGANAHYRTSILFGVKNKPGSLFDAIKSFKDFGVNMTKIESRPSKKTPWEYVFFVDIDGGVTDKLVLGALKELDKHCEFVKVLGSYPRIN